MGPVQILDTAQFAEAIVGQTVTPEIGGEGLGHNHPASGVDGGPVAMKRHFNPAVRAEHRGGLPGDVGQKAGRQVQTLERGRIVEQRRDPLVKLGAMLAEAMLAAACVAGRLDQRVELAAVLVEL